MTKNNHFDKTECLIDPSEQHTVNMKALADVIYDCTHMAQLSGFMKSFFLQVSRRITLRGL